MISQAHPFEVMERLNHVKYRVKKVRIKGKNRAVLINKLKKFVCREEVVVNMLIVVAEEQSAKRYLTVGLQKKFIGFVH